MKPGLFADVEKSLAGSGEWCSPEKAVALAAMVAALRPRAIVEIGVWTGSSLVPMALAAKALGMWTDPRTDRPVSCKVHAIDPWDPGASVIGQDAENAAWWADKAKHEWAYGLFMERLSIFELGHVVEVYRDRSDNVQPLAGIGLLHIDGNHGEQAIADVKRFAPNVRVGGIAILDDFHWTGGAVERAGLELEQMGFRPLYELGTGMVFQRVGMR